MTACVDLIVEQDCANTHRYELGAEVPLQVVQAPGKAHAYDGLRLALPYAVKVVELAVERLSHFSAGAVGVCILS